MSRTIHQERHREKKILGWIFYVGLPECQCGCGGMPKWDKHGDPGRFLPGHNKRVESNPTAGALRSKRENGIPVGDFRRLLVAMKRRHGWTWDEVATRAQVKRGHINNLMYGKRAKTVSRRWERGFYRRLLQQEDFSTAAARKALRG
jgi:hypothetical protein